MTGKELVQFVQQARYPDACNILARFLERPDVILQLEKRGYSQISLDKLRDCIRYPTGRGHREYMEKMLLSI